MHVRRPAIHALLIGAVVLSLAAGSAWTAPTREQCEAVEQHQSCLSCALLCAFIESVEVARLDVGAIENGVIIHASADDPGAVLDLQRYAFERHKLHSGFESGDTLEGLCEPCKRRIVQLFQADHALANSAHGVFTIITSDEPEMIAMLHTMAAEVVLEQEFRGL